MPPLKHCLFSLSHLSQESVISLFHEVKKAKIRGIRPLNMGSPKVILTVFSEPSTRTKMSFQMASFRLGVEVLSFEPDAKSSTSKGESFKASLENLAAMKPDLVVIRYGHEVDSQSIQTIFNVPIVSAGGGVNEHPTQALLDHFTIFENFQSIENKRVLIVGDLEHSRVARSNFELLKKFNCEVTLCSPKFLQPKDVEAWDGALITEDLMGAIENKDVCMILRPQKERHQNGDFLEEYAQKYCFGRKHLEKMSSETLVMHPGPFNEGIDIDTKILSDARVKIYDQVENGVFIRAMILKRMLSGEGLV